MTDLELIHYNLKILGGEHFCPEEDTYLITKTINRLPRDLWDKITDEVMFISVSNVHGFYAYHPVSVFNSETDSHFIVLNIGAIKDQEEKMYVVAHEIAHYILGHHFDNFTKGQDIEQEADNLAEQWGFTVPQTRKEGDYYYKI
jgi:hypothetical protein